ncbi:MAG: heavy-metal-associated domain-containing protein [Sphingobacteriales bacterium]|nr:MAG: heavy-metal-associated domain-containing protein [Sphingobacteriales bacterium]
MRKSLVFFLLFLCSLHARAQFTQAEVSVNGLTCSQCSRSVEMALKRLDFIATVEMDLQQPAAHIVFKKNEGIDFSKLAAAVRDAGFNVRSIKTRFEAPGNVASTCFLDNKIRYFNAGNTVQLNPGTSLLLLGNDLISKTELDKYKQRIKLARPVSCDQKAKKDIPFIVLN